ncbi:hypothetical protein ZWY2020_014222 [Hordeum vulgare]|nr:hypothetical protein ZWY2020_014222 [Hordeum vulgare]
MNTTAWPPSLPQHHKTHTPSSQNAAAANQAIISKQGPPVVPRGKEHRLSPTSHGLSLAESSGDGEREDAGGGFRVPPDARVNPYNLQPCKHNLECS